MAHGGFRCVHCGSQMQYQPGADVHCGNDCARERLQMIAEAIEQLRLEGFVKDQKAPNIWVKDRVAVTIEQILQEGFDAVMESHSGVVREISAADGASSAGSA